MAHASLSNNLTIKQTIHNHMNIRPVASSVGIDICMLSIRPEYSYVAQVSFINASV